MSENRRGDFFDSHCRCRPGDADPCPANGFAAFRHPSVAPDTSLSADRHVPDTGGEPFANLFGLWQQRIGWPPGLFGPTTPVSAERGCAVDLGLSPAAIRRHLQRARLPPLAACPRENRVQDRPIDLQSRPRTTERNCAGVSRPIHMCRRPTQSTIVAFCRHQSPGSASQQTVDCWWPSFCGRRPADME